MLSLLENTSPQNKKFWLVFDIPNDTDDHSLLRLGELSKGILHGVKGVSSSREIVTEWFHVGRNACLVMDAQQCIGMNNLQEVRYRDLDSLCENNFEILRRLFNQMGPQGNYNLMQTLMSHVERDLWPNNWYWDEIRIMAVKKWENNPHGIDCVKDVGHFIMNILGEAPPHIQRYYDEKPFDVRTILQRALGRMGQQYEVESEWLVRSDSFHVPSGSILMISHNTDMVNRAKKWAENPTLMTPNEGYYRGLLCQLQNIKDFHLADRYVIRFIDSHKFAQVRSNVVTRRSGKR